MSPRRVFGSHRVPLSGAVRVGPARSQDLVAVTLALRLSRERRMLEALHRATTLPPRNRTYVDQREFGRSFGASKSALATVAAFARKNGLRVLQQSSERACVEVVGTVAAVSRAFNVALDEYRYPGGVYRGRSGFIHLPSEVVGLVQGVFGLDDRPQVRSHAHVAALYSQNRRLLAPYSGVDVAKHYHFPAGFDGRGQTIGVLEFGGGYRPADLKSYQASLGLPASKITNVHVDGARNNPHVKDISTLEVALDIQVIAALAPGARIVVYFAPKTDRGFFDALSTAVHDTINRPSILSISWGNPEKHWTRQALRSFDWALQAAALMGMTVCVSSGDFGSTDGETDNLSHVDFPASSPLSLACGGTRLARSATGVLRETVWNDGPASSGGGISNVFPLPKWQQGVRVGRSSNPDRRTGRGVPDVCSMATPGFKLHINGSPASGGGTSAAAPLWAALIARMNQALGFRLGFANPALYAPVARRTLRDIRVGNNGAYRAHAGWDACTGLGSPNGDKLLEALSNL